MSAIAILSDVNGNLEALHAVLKDAESNCAERYVFLGDAIGYGASPLECISVLRQVCDVYLLGKFEHELVSQKVSDIPYVQNTVASVLSSADQIEWLSTQTASAQVEEFWCTSLNPVGQEYTPLLREDVLLTEPFGKSVFEALESQLLLGGNHQSWVLDDVKRNLDSVSHCSRRFEGKRVVSVGSVGQPRDGDWRASYVLLTSSRIEWRRVEYDIDTSISKIEAIIGVGNPVGQRLKMGI